MKLFFLNFPLSYEKLTINHKSLRKGIDDSRPELTSLKKSENIKFVKDCKSLFLACVLTFIKSKSEQMLINN